MPQLISEFLPQVASNGTAVTCVVCSPVWLRGAGAVSRNNAPLGYCSKCSIGLPAGYRPSYAAYIATVSVQHWLNSADERAQTTLTAILRASLDGDKSVTSNDRVAARLEASIHYRGSYHNLWLSMPFELWVYETFTSVNTPLPVHVMEFFNA
jgi:hypothetical protein